MNLKPKITPCFGAVLVLLLGASAYSLYSLLRLGALAREGAPAGFEAVLAGQQFVVGLAAGALGLFFMLRRFSASGAALRQLHDYRTAPLAQVLAERNRLASIVDSLDAGLLLLDENRRVLVANPAIGRLLGQPVAELTGRSIEELARQSALLAQLLPHLSVPAGGPGAETPVLTLPQQGGEASYRLLTRSVVAFNEATAKTEPVGTLLTLHDVSDYRQLDQVKWRFLTSVSQELHTPLSRMQLSLLRLQDGKAGPLTPEQHNIAYTLARDNKHLLKVVHELLDVSQLELGAIQLNFQVARLPEIVQFVAGTIRPQLQPKRLVLEVQVPANLPTVRADIEKTTWVLLSLLANAIRYAHLQDTLHIRAGLLPTGQHVQVSVQDQGPGIAPDMQERIFQRFSQVPAQGGSGLGLSIAREFMASQGGQLWVESEPGAGSTFSFTLPVVREG
jgi:NtrC-family two-component system sensor histidine kinase KinB